MSDELDQNPGTGLLQGDEPENIEQITGFEEPEGAETPEIVTDVTIPPAETPAEETNPPVEWKPSVPEGLYTPEEKARLIQMLDSVDPTDKFEAQNYMNMKAQQYYDQIRTASEALTASVPTEFMQLHRPHVLDYLNNRCSPERRATPEAVDEAQAWAIMQRAKQIGWAKATAEAQRLYGQGDKVTGDRVTIEKEVIPPAQRAVTSTVSASPVMNGTRTRRPAGSLIMSALGLPEDE